MQIVVNDSGFLKYSWAHKAIFNTAAWRFLTQCHPRAQRSNTFNWGFMPCPTCTGISLDNLDLFTILRMIVGERPKFFALLHCQMWFLICLTLLSWNLAQSSALLAKTEMLLLHPNMTPWHLTNSPAYYELFQNSLKRIFYNLFTFILPLSQLFWDVLQPSKSKCVYIYKIHLRWSVKTLEICSKFFCQLIQS